jgi:outer membrane biosynthesis protein TonB
MAPLANLSREEKIGLWIAGGAHIALGVALVVQVGTVAPYTPPQRITVSLATDVSLETTSPDPSPNPAVAAAPELAPLPEVAEAPPPEPAPRVVETPRVQPVVRPTPTPTASSRPTPTPTATRNAGSSRMDELREGLSDAAGLEGTQGERPSPQQQASINAAIIRQLKPHWNPPSGVEVDRLVTVVRFRLNRDGSLNGNPEVVETTGITNANRTQANRHREQAVRAVRLAAPFNLPERFYSGWRVVTSNFNNELAQ